MRIYPYPLAIILGLLAALALLASCATPPVERFSGPVCFDIHIVPDKDKLPEKCVALGAEACAGENKGKLDVWMVGERSVGHYTYVNEYFLGHEVRHLLNWKWPDRFEDPDKPGWFLGDAKTK